MHQLSKPTLEKYFSKSRLAKYQELAGTNGDFLVLYKQNIEESKKFFAALIQFEVVLRNSISEQLSEDFGSDWWGKADLIFKQQEMIREAKSTLLKKDRELSSCNVISNLSFGFWASLFSPYYDKSLWRKSLCKVFYSNKARPSRGADSREIRKISQIAKPHFSLRMYHPFSIRKISPSTHRNH